MLATLPAAVAIGAALWLRERLPPRAWAAAALAAGGVAAVTLARAGPASGAGSGTAGSLPGVLLVFVGVCGEAAYALLARRAADRVPLLTASLWMQGFSAVLLLPFWLPDAAAAFGALRDPGLLLLLVFHALTASVLSLLLWYAGVRRVPAATAGVFMAFLPGFAALTAVLFLGERFTAAHAAGLLLLAGSVALATWPGRAHRDAPAGLR